MADTRNAGGGNADGPPDGDLAGRLSRMSDRTSLMVIDATLNALPQSGQGYADAAQEVRALARRIALAAGDFQATVAPETAA